MKIGIPFLRGYSFLQETQVNLSLPNFKSDLQKGHAKIERSFLSIRTLQEGSKRI